MPPDPLCRAFLVSQTALNLFAEKNVEIMPPRFLDFLLRHWLS